MALKTLRAAAFAAKHFAAQALAGTKQLLASLGAWGGYLRTEKPKRKKSQPEIVPESIPDPVVSRIQTELLAASLAADVIERAKQQAKRRKNQQLAILLTL